MSKAGTITPYEIIALVIAFGALLVSFRSCQISNANKNISNEALEASKYQFFQLNRPWIILSPEKFENGMFWDISQKNTHIVIALKYGIQNVGNIAAKDIFFPEKMGIVRGRKLLTMYKLIMIGQRA